MARLVSTVLVVALLAATAAAFAWTEALKLQPSPITAVRFPTKVFSPICDCATEQAPFRLRLREADVLDVDIVDEGGAVVSSVARGERGGPGWVDFAWDGRDGSGQVLPEATYRPRVRLRRKRETIVIPNDIRLDVTPPVVETWDARPRVFSPDGDGRADSLAVRYASSEDAVALLYVEDVRRVRTRFARAEDTFRWSGRVGGEPLRRGVYDVQLALRDPAGNVSVRAAPAKVVVRYVALGRDRVTVRAGGRFAIRVSADARTVRWRLGSRSGTSRPGTLRLRAPARKGRYTLTVSVGRHVTRAAIVVREPAP
ncbi:MAG TPA: FlgD immunoglobulin-like domain containing protein [Gaiellaceae bacterium]|nr:FlgD immunoglobulin-like domain containing protein [Gaiellaceae bacterium]